VVYNLNWLTNDYLTLVTWQTRVENVQPAKEIAIHAVIKNSNHFRAWSTKITKGILRGVRYQRRCKRVWQNLDSTLHWRRYRASDVKRGSEQETRVRFVVTSWTRLGDLRCDSEMSGPLDKQDDAADQVPASICRVHCGFCNVMLAVCRIIILKIDIDSSYVTLKSESGRVCEEILTSALSIYFCQVRWFT
jgi:hypothetical protein